MATETNLTKLNINKLTAAQYLEADIQGQINQNELYVLKDAIYDSKVVIDDTKASDSTTYSSNKIKNDFIRNTGNNIMTGTLKIKNRNPGALTVEDSSIKVSTIATSGEYSNRTTDIRYKYINFIHQYGGTSESTATTKNRWYIEYDDTDLSGTNSFFIKLPNKSGTLALTSDISGTGSANVKFRVWG